MESEADHMEKITHNIAYCFRIYPNREQEVLLEKHLVAVVFYIIRC
ncbi:helix-turn-helix domain-containing protein [Eubacterium ramulus]